MQEFTVTEEHLKLMRRACVRWEDCEFGAPSIDCKRPYGNSGVIQDIREILGEEGEVCLHCGEPPDDGDDERYRKLHAETETVLEIILSTGLTLVGTYRRDNDYGGTWRPSDD